MLFIGTPQRLKHTGADCTDTVSVASEAAPNKASKPVPVCLSSYRMYASARAPPWQPHVTPRPYALAPRRKTRSRLKTKTCRVKTRLSHSRHYATSKRTRASSLPLRQSRGRNDASRSGTHQMGCGIRTHTHAKDSLQKRVHVTSGHSTKSVGLLSGAGTGTHPKAPSCLSPLPRRGPLQRLLACQTARDRSSEAFEECGRAPASRPMCFVAE